MANSPDRVRTHRAQRKLTDAKVHQLLNEYAYTTATYTSLSEKYGVCIKSIGNIVNGVSYRDLVGVSALRRLAQEKATTRSAKYSIAKTARVPDASMTLIEVNLNSIQSVLDAILRLQTVLPLIVEVTL